VTACFTSMSVRNGLPARCFVKVPKRWKLLPTRLMTHCSTTDWRSYTTHLPVPISCPVMSVSWTPWEGCGWQAISNRRQCETSCSLPVYCRYTSLGAMMGQILKNVNCDYLEDWCVASATRMPAMCRCQNKFLSIRLFVPLFLKLPCVWARTA
jgi:hypothetical protein